mgnify:CR=1 FL=1
MPSTLRISLILWSACALWSTDARAQAFLTTEAIGLSSARRALGSSNDALYLNPAGLARKKAYTLELDFADDLRGSERRFHASITDGQAGPVAGGIGFTYSTAAPRVPREGRARFEGWRLDGALAAKAGDRFAIGVGLKGFVYDLNIDDAPSGERLGLFTVDAGMQILISDSVVLGLVGRNLTRPSQAEVPLEAGGGLGFQKDAFAIEADVVYEDFVENIVFTTGTSYTINEMVPIRLGTVYDAGQEEFGLSFGLGLEVGRFGLDLAYAQRLTGIDSAIQGDDERIFGASLHIVPL